MNDGMDKFNQFIKKAHNAIRAVAKLQNEMEMVKSFMKKVDSFMYETAERVEELEEGLYAQPNQDLSHKKEKLELAKQSLADISSPLSVVTVSNVTIIREALADYEKLLDNSQ